MKPKMHASLKVALAVYRKLDLKPLEASNSDIMTYSNGRESGLCLRYMAAGCFQYICWAECRGSDQIVIYVGKKDEHFEDPGMVPTERAYHEGSKYLDAGEYEKAARFIAQSLFTRSSK